MYCVDCGNKIEKEDAFCRNCGKKLDKKLNIENRDESIVENRSNGAAIASFVLGIMSICASVITSIISIVFYEYILDRYEIFGHIVLSDEAHIRSILTCVFINILPIILSFIGLLLGIICHKKSYLGCKIAGIVINVISIMLCIIPLILIITLK